MLKGTKTGDFSMWGDYLVPRRILNAGEGGNKIRDKSDRHDIAVRHLFVIGSFTLLGVSLDLSGRINVTACCMRNPSGTPRAVLFSRSPRTEGTFCIVHLRPNVPFLSGELVKKLKLKEPKESPLRIVPMRMHPSEGGWRQRGE